MTPGFAAVPTVSPSLRGAAGLFGDARGYLNAASAGLPTRETIGALTRELAEWFDARRDPKDYIAPIARSRAHYASLVGVRPDRVAIGSQTSVMASLIAAAVPRGAEVLCVEGDFTSMIFPFLQRGDIRVRTIPLADLAGAISGKTWLVAFSLVQSATGAVADVAAIRSAAKGVGARTFCDTTQAAGVMPVDAAQFDVTACHAYKWLCSPRGVAFLTVSSSFQRALTPIQAGWYAGDDVWQSCYGPSMHLAADARQFDVSPAWQAWIGAEPALRLFASLDIAEVWTHASGLGDRLCDALGMERQHQAIVTWADPDGSDLHRLFAAGIRASGRAGRVRIAFHLWNDESDVAAVVHCVR